MVTAYIQASKQMNLLLSFTLNSPLYGLRQCGFNAAASAVRRYG